MVCSSQWDIIWKNREKKAHDSILHLQGCLLNLLLTVRTISPEMFQQTLRHTFFIQDLLYLQITPDSTYHTEKQVVKPLDVQRMQSYIWYNNIMTVLIQASITGSDGDIARKLNHQMQSQPSIVEQYLVENKGNIPLLLSISGVNLSQLFIHNLTLQMKEFLSQLDRVIEFDQVLLVDLVSSEFNMLSYQLSSVLRLLGIMLGYKPFVQDMGFDRLNYTGENDGEINNTYGNSNSSSIVGNKSSVEVKLLFTLLLQLHDAISTVLSQSKSLVQSTIKSVSNSNNGGGNSSVDAVISKQIQSVYSLLLSRVEHSIILCLTLSDECRHILFPIPITITNSISNDNNNISSNDSYGHAMIALVVSDITSALSYIDSGKSSNKATQSVSPNTSNQKW
jgi:hypothetical protein